jgi:hypothetical protein
MHSHNTPAQNARTPTTATETQCFTMSPGLVVRSGLAVKQAGPSARVALRRSSTRQIVIAAAKGNAGAGDEGKFAKLEARLDALKKDAAGYKGSEVEDLADGLVDDVTNLQKRLEETKKTSDKKKTSGIMTAAGAAAIVAILAFIFGPKRAGATELMAFSATAVQESTLVPSPAQSPEVCFFFCSPPPPKS